MGLGARQRFTFEEYLQLEEIAEVKHEFLEGQVWAMAGGSPEHAAIIGNVTTLLNVQLRGQRCRVYTTELRVRAKVTGLGTYPDITVVCGRLERDLEDRGGHTVTNPRVLVEVLSPSTEAYDRGEKLSPLPDHREPRGDRARRPGPAGDRGHPARARLDVVAPPRRRGRVRSLDVDRV